MNFTPEPQITNYRKEDLPGRLEQAYVGKFKATEFTFKKYDAKTGRIEYQWVVNIPKSDNKNGLDIRYYSVVQFDEWLRLRVSYTQHLVPKKPYFLPLLKSIGNLYLKNVGEQLDVNLPKVEKAMEMNCQII